MQQLQQHLQDHQAGALLLTFLPDVRWACGFSGSNGLLLVTKKRTHFFSDGRYTVQAQKEVREATVHTPGYQLWKYIEENGFLQDVDSVVFQSDHVTVEQLSSLEERFSGITWVPQSGLLTEDVASKQQHEIDAIKSAQEITDTVFEQLLSFIKPGMTEREVAARLIYEHLQRGADKMSFDPIVAAGLNGALPHARPSDRTIQEGELIVIDMGCFKDGYASDMTRTVAVGEPDEKSRRAYQAVLKAQEAAISAAHAGMTGKELDAVARDVLVDAGFAEYFSHGLGHGVGLQVHEWPKLSYHVEHTLPEHAAVTIEPGVYLPEEFGIRIEDIIVLEKDGAENLTNARKDLIVL